MSVRIKVARTKLIEALQERLKTAEKANEQQEKNRETLSKLQLAYGEKIMKLSKSGKLPITNARKYWNRIEITFDIAGLEIDLPEEPKVEPVDGVLAEYELREIKNAIRMLQLSDEENVNTSTYKDVARYL